MHEAMLSPIQANLDVRHLMYQAPTRLGLTSAVSELSHIFLVEL